MSKYDEKDWGIEIERCDDGDLLLRQGECGCGDDVTVRLHTCHFSLMAKYLELMTHDEFDNATTRNNDRLHLLASLINAHLPPEHPLVIATTALLGFNGQRYKQKQGNTMNDDNQLTLIEE